MVLGDEPRERLGKTASFPQENQSFIDWPYGVVASVWTFVQRGPINDVVDEEVEVDIKHSLHHDAEMV